jgi:pSer/pThr/pTyr-binding forkhead associated (FHA) protein
VPEYELEIVEGPEAGRRIRIDGVTEIGRDPSVGPALMQDELVSRRHVRLTPDAEGLRVEDLDSRNGTFVNGDQIFTPAHVPIDGQILVGVTVMQLRAAGANGGMTAVRRIPESLTVFRPLPSATQEPEPPTQQTPTLAIDETDPDYVPLSVLETGDQENGALLRLLDSRTKAKARGAPIGLFVLAALAVILYLALR